MLAKKQEAPAPAAQPPPEPVLTLAQRYKAAFDEMTRLGNELIEGHIDFLKQCHPSLPRQTLEMDLYKHRGCTCTVALEVVAAKEKEQS